MGKVKFYLSDKDKFNRLGIKDPDGFYFIEDTRELYKGEDQIVGDFSVLPIATFSQLGGVKVSATVNAQWIQENYPDLDMPGSVLKTIEDGENKGFIFLNANPDNFENNNGVFELKIASPNNIGGVATSISYKDGYQVDSMVDSNGILKGIIKSNSITSNEIANDVIPKNLSDFYNDLSYQTKEEVTTAINNAVSTTYKVKGSTTRDSLPSNPTVGDVWNLTDEDGQNVVWTGTDWDNLGSTIELTWDAIQGKPTNFEAVPHRHDNVTSSADGFMSKEDKVKLDGIEQYANNYSLPVASDTILGGIKLQPDNPSNNYTSVKINNSQFAYVDYATEDTPGTVKPGQYMSVDSEGNINCNIPWNEV